MLNNSSRSRSLRASCADIPFPTAGCRYAARVSGCPRDFLAALPKTELHVHLEGSMQPELLLSLARKHRIADVPDTLDDVRAWYEFRDFAHFIDIYRSALRVLRDEEDFAALAADVLAGQNVRHAEINVSLSNHLRRGVPTEAVFAGLEEARLVAEVEHGITARWIPDFSGDYGAAAGEATLDAALRHGSDSLVGFSVGGIEVDRDPFAEVFARARANGLRSLPHAGETEGPDRVWSAIRALGAERIGHGIGSVRDPALMEHLGEHRLPVDVSPTSNLRTRSVPSVEEHPLPQMLRAGLLVTLNTDDPTMFGTDLIGEYRAAQRMGLQHDELAQLARNGVRASFLEPQRKSVLLDEIDAVAAEHG